MLSLISVINPPPALCNISVRTVVKLSTLGVFCALGVSLVSWIMMIYACVSWISSLSSSSLFFIPFMLTSSMMTFLTLLLLWMCACVVSVVIRSSLVCLWGCLGTLCGCGGCCNWHVCMLRVWGCEGDGNAGVGDEGSVVVVSSGHVMV